MLNLFMIFISQLITALGWLLLFSLDACLAENSVPPNESRTVISHTFTYNTANEVNSVSLAGNFNDWNPLATPMTTPDGGKKWQITLLLASGHYTYKFVVNKKDWVTDPQAGTESDDHGNINSSISLGPPNAFPAPLYWSAYEYNYKKDGFIPEQEWSKNIDWVEANLKSYGYKMVAIDGWGDEVYNQDGYRTTHSREWKHDYAWWSANLQARGMQLGIYNNPLWITKAAADAGIKIKGTDILIKSIMDGEGKFNWVNVDKPGAEEYVKGYVQFYADMGVRFLRIDFLSWYLSGHDRYMGKVGPVRTQAQYEKALRWIREACDANGIFLSLVMPDLNHDAEVEVQYGHMIRVDEDCSEGGWGKFSKKRRGIRLDGWSQYANAFDGLIYWSHLTGPHQIILDPDFIRLNTFSSDAERRSVISLYLVAGAPLSVADQYSTIGDSLSFYENQEILDLNKDNFIGHPLTCDPTNENSQIWTGQLSNGDWIVAFFNRESKSCQRKLAFSDLGLEGKVLVRDLWQHKDLGYYSEFSIDLAPHDCLILRLNTKTSQSN